MQLDKEMMNAVPIPRLDVGEKVFAAQLLWQMIPKVLVANSYNVEPNLTLQAETN